MVLRALVVSEDHQAITILNSVLAEFGVTVHCFADPKVPFSVPEYKLDALIVDFEQSGHALAIIQSVRSAPSPPVIIALLTDVASVRNTFAEGANFVLYKPLSGNKVYAGLRPAISLMKHERRRSFRVAVQVPARLVLEDGAEREGVILDLSEHGMDVLAAEPICPSSRLQAEFTLSGEIGPVELGGEVAWANPNGQSGVRFVDLAASQQGMLKNFVDNHAKQFIDDDLWMDSSSRLTDLSLGGCYVETESPVPEHSLVQISLTANDVEASAEGTVRVMHPNFGMGIEFSSQTSEEQSQVEDILNLLTSCPGTHPRLKLTPRALNAPARSTGESLDKLNDPLLELLRNHQSFDQEQFLQALQRQRSSHEVSNS
jgi:FixJ family two-component response regulator